MTPRIILAALAALAFAPAAQSAELEALIERNQKALEESVRQYQVLEPDEPALPPARLWVHARGPEQGPLVREIEEQAGALALRGGAIDFKPVQEVDYGPSRSQLRFFRPEDRDRAHALADALADTVPNLAVADFSAQYANVRWLEAGHLELWLSPDLP